MCQFRIAIVGRACNECGLILISTSDFDQRCFLLAFKLIRCVSRCAASKCK